MTPDLHSIYPIETRFIMTTRPASPIIFSKSSRWLGAGAKTHLMRNVSWFCNYLLIYSLMTASRKCLKWQTWCERPVQRLALQSCPRHKKAKTKALRIQIDWHSKSCISFSAQMVQLTASEEPEWFCCWKNLQTKKWDISLQSDSSGTFCKMSNG